MDTRFFSFVGERSSRGQAIAVSTFMIAVGVLAVAGLFGFELTRSTLAREQLKTACQAAAMAGASTMAGSDEKDTRVMQLNAMGNAMNVFKRNHCLGVSLANAQNTAADAPKCDPYDCYVKMEFTDPDQAGKPVPLGDPKGKVLKITSTYGLQPAFHQFLRLPTVALQAGASAGVPMMDIVMAFDVSGSIDDQTPVTFVKRYWDAGGKVMYSINPTPSGCKAGPLAQGKLYDILGPRPTGTGTNALYPQDLLAAGLSDNRWPQYFSEFPGFGPHSARGLRGKNADKGTKPGNAPGSSGNGGGDDDDDDDDDNSGPGSGPSLPPGPSGVGTSRTFTDLVVNIDGKDAFAGASEGGYDFPDLATLVEASRGNLENEKVFKASGASTSVTVQPRAGYQQKYIELARKHIHPLGDAQDAAKTFFTILNNDTNAHFGLVSFSTHAGNTGSGPNWFNIDEYYPQGGRSRFPTPLVELDPGNGVTKYDEIMQKIPTTTAYGGTNIGDSIHVAVQMLKSKARPGARKAIVLFTDGQPTSGGPLTQEPWANARAAAKEAKDAGIPIYAIGLAQNPEIIPGEKAILNDWDPNPGSGGVAAIAGNDGRFFLVTDQKYLRMTFQNLARQFVQIVRG
jgi:hypothetical protein